MSPMPLLAGLLFLALTAPAQAQSQPAAAVAQGKKLWQQHCSGCHAVDADETGPRHRGVFGRQAGTVKGYDYSRALRRSGVQWNAAALDRWLTDPEKFIPGQNMDFKVTSKAERTALITYLQSIAAPVTPSVTPAPAQNSRAATDTPRR